MKKLVWILGALLLLSFVFPDGIKLPAKPQTPAAEPAAVTDHVIVELLAAATVEDKARVNGIYSGLKNVVDRAGFNSLVTNTEKWALLQANTLTLAVEQVNKYPGLDKAIDNVFRRYVGTDDVVSITPEILKKLSDACATIAASAASK